MKQSKGLNGDLKPEHKKATNRTMNGTTTGIYSRMPTIWKKKIEGDTYLIMQLHFSSGSLLLVYVL